MPLHYCTFRNARDTSPAPKTGEWSELLPDLTQHLTGPKESAPLWSPVAYTSGATRGRAGVEYVSMVVLDLDKLKDPTPVRERCDQLEQTGYAYALHSTYSHNPQAGVYSYRLVLPLDKAVPARNWPQVWAAAVQWLNLPADPACKDPSRLYYAPTQHPSRSPEARGQAGRPWTPPEVVLAPGATAATSIPGDAIAVPVSKNDLRSAATRWARKGEQGQTLARALRKIVDGDPWGEAGGRDTIATAIIWRLAQEFPNVSDEQWRTVWAKSCAAIAEPDLDVDVIVEKIARAREKRVQENDARRLQRQQSQDNRLADAWERATGIRRATPYTPEELDRWGLTANRWVIQYEDAYWFWVAGRYLGPYGGKSAGTTAHTLLMPAAQAAELDLFERSDKSVKRKQLPQIVLDYGTTAGAYALSYCAERSHYDTPTSTFIEAAAEQREIEPKPHTSIQQWIEALAGGDQDMCLTKWIAWVTHLDRTCALLYLQGPPGVGKSLLAAGLARIWTVHGPTALTAAFGDFNAEIRQCPLLFGDEIIPKDRWGRTRTAELRDLVQATERDYKQKYIPSAKLLGANRIMVAANNARLLDGEDAISSDDAAAISERVLHIRCGEAARSNLPSQVKQWVEKDMIAEHALWLRDQIPIPEDAPRFLITPPLTELHLTMGTKSAIGSAIAHWIVGWVLAPDRLTQGAPPGSSAHWSRLDPAGPLVHPQTLIDFPETYLTNVPKTKFNARAVSESLEALSHGRATYQNRQVFRVRVESLVAWAQNAGLANRAQIQRGLCG